METKKSLKNRKSPKNLNEVSELSESEKCYSHKALTISKREVVSTGTWQVFIKILINN